MGRDMPDPFRQWQARVSLAQQRAQRERKDAEMNLFQIAPHEAGYKTKFLPPSELRRLRHANRRSRWT